MMNEKKPKIKIVKAARLQKESQAPEKSDKQKAIDRRRLLLHELSKIEQQIKPRQ